MFFSKTVLLVVFLSVFTFSRLEAFAPPGDYNEDPLSHEEKSSSQSSDVYDVEQNGESRRQSQGNPVSITIYQEGDSEGKPSKGLQLLLD
ncbi:hypothetical protein [Desulfonatronum sp. SC1]|uniref:hypothetical protein n=1 Tax=Desulfonatronum sp. SC1 TaxID=2109626 RepID=UPI0011B224D2|nr:hypothetical protein [Desulfonatronum sp. SC1]